MRRGCGSGFRIRFMGARGRSLFSGRPLPAGPSPLFRGNRDIGFRGDGRAGLFERCDEVIEL